MRLSDFQIKCNSGWEVMRTKHKLHLLGQPVLEPYLTMTYGGYVRNLDFEWCTGTQYHSKTTVSYEEFMHVIGESQ